MIDHNNCRCPIGDIAHRGDYSRLCPDCLMPNPSNGDISHRECAFTVDKSNGLKKYHWVDSHGRHKVSKMWPTVQEDYCFYHMKKRSGRIA